MTPVAHATQEHRFYTTWWDTTTESKAVLDAAKKDIISLPTLNAKRFDQENIKALAVLIKNHGKEKLLIQEFSPRQSIERKFSLVLDGDTFGRLTSPAFSIGSTLTGILEDDKIKFRLFSRMKIVFDLTDIYQEATDTEVEDFCKLSRIGVADHEAFKNIADQKMRKLIHVIIDRNTLGKYTASQIAEAAATQGFDISVKKHQIVMPSEKGDAKALLHFLDDGLYRAALTGEIFITNSKRKHKSA